MLRWGYSCVSHERIDAERDAGPMVLTLGHVGSFSRRIINLIVGIVSSVQQKQGLRRRTMRALCGVLALDEDPPRAHECSCARKTQRLSCIDPGFLPMKNKQQSYSSQSKIHRFLSSGNIKRGLAGGSGENEAATEAETGIGDRSVGGCEAVQKACHQAKRNT